MGFRAKERPLLEIGAASRTCKKCGRELPETTEFFGLDRGSFRRACKKCDYARVKAWHVAHRGRIREIKRRSAERAGEAGRSRRAETARNRRVADPERFRQYGRQWYADNVHKAKATTHNCRAKRAGSTGRISGDDIAARIELQRGLCHWCGQAIGDAEYTIDHVIPLSRGGQNVASNIAISCAKCNERKGASLPAEFLQRTNGAASRSGASQANASARRRRSRNRT